MLLPTLPSCHISPRARGPGGMAVKAQAASSFVAGLTATPVQAAVTSAANAQRLRLVRALELLHTSAVQLDAAHAEAAKRAGEAAELREAMEAMKKQHVEEVKAARKEASVRHDLALQATHVRRSATPTVSCMHAPTTPAPQNSDRVQELEAELRARDEKLLEKVRSPVAHGAQRVALSLRLVTGRGELCISQQRGNAGG